jgi:hypothetical protein
MKGLRMLVKRTCLVLALALVVFGAGSGSASAQKAEWKCWEVVDGEMYEVSCDGWDL